VTIPVGAPLKEALEAAAKDKGSTVILITMDSTWRMACVRAGVVGVTFNDLRGTAVTRLAFVGCTEAEIASITSQQKAQGDVFSFFVQFKTHRPSPTWRSATAAGLLT
jgi:hypothetical protein